jgi:hypothetical protein
MPNLNTLLDRCVLLVYEFFDRFFLNGYVARFVSRTPTTWPGS